MTAERTAGDRDDEFLAAVGVCEDAHHRGVLMAGDERREVGTVEHRCQVAVGAGGQWNFADDVGEFGLPDVREPDRHVAEIAGPRCRLQADGRSGRRVGTDLAGLVGAEIGP